VSEGGRRKHASVGLSEFEFREATKDFAGNMAGNILGR